ncbi:MAG: hypothetical protein ACSHXY_03045 [Alphaproteobacteria bacterium]
MSDALIQTLSMLVVVFVSSSATGWIYKFGKNAQPVYLDGQQGTISPGKLSAWFTIIGGL